MSDEMVTDAEIEAELLAGDLGTDPPTCAICGKPCIFTTNASRGGATLNTALAFLCPDHPGYVYWMSP